MNLTKDLHTIKKDLHEAIALERRVYDLEVKSSSLESWRWAAIIAISLLTVLTLAVSLIIVIAALTQPDINQVEQINQPIYNSTIQ